MAASISLANFTAFLKENYTKEAIDDLTLKNNRFFNMLDKNEKVGGVDYKVPLIYSSNTRRSATFSTAQAASANVGYVAFQMTMAQDYCLATWDGKALKGSEGDANAFASVAKIEMDRSIRALHRSYGVKLARTGTGSCAVISSGATVAGLTLLLSQITDAANFEVGDTVTASATDGSALRTGSAVVTAVDRVQGILTTASTNWSTKITSLATGDFLYRAGDEANAAANICTEGLLSFGPAATTALTTAFYGVTRSADQSRLACYFYDNSSLGAPIDEALVSSVSAVQAQGAQTDAIFINPVKFRQLVNRMSSKIVRVSTDQKTGKMGFGAVMLLTDDGEIPVYSDINVDSRYAHVLQMDTWELVSSGPAIGLLDFDGNQTLRVYNADGYEARLGGYAQLACHAPGFNAVVTL